MNAPVIVIIVSLVLFYVIVPLLFAKRRMGSAVFWVVWIMSSVVSCFALQRVYKPLRILNLPELDAAAFHATAPGRNIVVTGALEDNKARTPDDLVAYIKERWNVEQDGDSSEGSWETVERVLPGLILSIDGGIIRTASADSAEQGGKRHSAIQYSDSPKGASGIPDGSIRYSGFKNGDRVTIVGEKASKESLIPFIFSIGFSVCGEASQAP
jgi:hypothetical protein